MAKLPAGSWKRFHRFNPYEDKEEARAAKIAAEWKIEHQQLKDVQARRPSDLGHKSSLTKRLKRAKVTLPNTWGT